MTLGRLLLIVALVGLIVMGALLIALNRPGGEPVVENMAPVVLAEGVELQTTASADQQALIRQVIASAEAAGEPAAVTIDYPLDGSIFPPDMAAPTFLWHDSAERADRWVINVALSDGEAHIYVLVEGGPPAQGEIDPQCLGETNEIYQPTAYQASANSWTPSADVWAAIKNASVATAIVTIIGYSDGEADKTLSAGSMTLTTSTDPVGAPIFYRDVPLMPSPAGDGTIKPLPNGALPLIKWRLKDVSRTDSRVVLTNMPTCGNCHSFSADGKTLGMDIDGPTGDKGAYAVVPVSENIVVEAKDIITWNSFPDKPAGHKTIGFLSRVSPDGQYVMTTVNEELYVVNFLDHRFLQVFYPTRGILAYYSRSSGRMKALPGADDPAYVHCDPVWTPDGETIVFARAAARDSSEPGRGQPRRAGEAAELPIQYDLYRIPFKDGQGGQPERIEGASQNGMSNTFPKVSPDGRWIVFVKCRNGQLMRPDSELWIVPAEGGQARRMTCNTSLMNSWHSFSPNGRWMVFSSKSNTPYTQMFLTHIDEDGNDSPPILIADATAANRAVNIPEFVKIEYDDLQSIRTPTIEYYRHYARGNDLMAAGKIDEAITEFMKALKVEATAVRVNNNVGLCLARLGRHKEAAVYFSRALVTNPRDWVVISNLASAYIQQGDHDNAIVLLKRAIEINAKYADAHYNMGYVLSLQGNFGRAVEFFRTAVDITPQTADYHRQLGRALAMTGELEEAEAEFREAIRLAPNYSGAKTDLADIVRALQQQPR